jgi:hypothetical protein
MTVRTIDHPEANGRKPQPGELSWSLRFPLEDGSFLIVQVGKAAHDAFKGMFQQEEIDDTAEGRHI